MGVNHLIICLIFSRNWNHGFHVSGIASWGRPRVDTCFGFIVDYFER